MAEKFGKRLKQANSGKKKDTTDFVKNTDFDNKLKSINKKITSKNVETEKNLNDLAEKVKLTSTKRWNVYLGKMYFTGNGGYQSFFVFFQCLIH